MDMDDGARRWLHRTARKHYWRVCRWYDYDDLVQDGVLHYWRIVRKYPAITSPRPTTSARRHIMSLFQRTYINHINDLANRRTRQPEWVVADLAPEAVDETSYLEGVTADAEVGVEQINLAGAPDAVRQLLRALATDEGCRRLGKIYRLRDSGARETLNERLCRIAGLSKADIDLVAMTKSFLAG